MQPLLKMMSVLLLILFAGSEQAVEARPTGDQVAAALQVKVGYVKEGYGTPEKPYSDEARASITGARVIAIDAEGAILAQGLTDRQGEWQADIAVPRDLRFAKKNMGMVTLITVADGYNENVTFDVPVNQFDDGVVSAVVTLRPIRADERNEPSFNAQLHRFTVFEMLDDYANRVGLVKQKPSASSGGLREPEMPWSAEIRKP
ncbi:hypothetical protein [Paenibacillus ferrarius]|uniref:hypothetical protein n=1 Tax=Paenibacillus ferrarius TaxID=1469647 RepID=UPI003D2B7025